MLKAEALEFIHESDALGSRLGLDRMKVLMDYMGHPERAFKCIHIAGTNGKGSTCAMTSAMLTQAGYRTGRFTSPWIETFEEQIAVDGCSIDERALIDAVISVKNAVEQMVKDGYDRPTTFEITTAMAFAHFRARNVDIAVIETGLGGETDATNVIEETLVSVFTPIALDHCQFLGETLTEIATVKSGIIKPKCSVVSAPQSSEVITVLRKKADKEACKWLEIDMAMVRAISIGNATITFERLGEVYTLNFSAPYQVQNAHLALSIIECLNASTDFEISVQAKHGGLKTVSWAARFEKVTDTPLSYVDGAHNPHGIEALAQSIRAHFKGRLVIGVVGVLADKDVEKMLGIILPELSEIVVTMPDNPRALNAVTLAHKVERHLNRRVLGVFVNPEDAVRFVAKAYGDRSDAVVIYFGSLYFLGCIKQTLNQQELDSQVLL